MTFSVRVPFGLLALPFDIIIIPHHEIEYNRQIIQISGLNFVQLFFIFRLTNFAGHGIMVISRREGRPRAAALLYFEKIPVALEIRK